MTEKMSKILFIIDHLGCGGAERITLQLAEYLAANDHSIHLAVLNGRLNYYHCTSGIDYTDLQLGESFAYGKIWKNKVLSPDEKTKIDTLLTNNFDLIITGYNNGHWLAPYLKGNVWHWIHGDLLEFRKFNNPLKQIKEHIRFFKNKRKFAELFKNRNLITVNRDLESKAQTYAQPKSTVTIANGVQVSDDLIAQAPYTEKKWDVIFVGRLVPIKQVDHAIKAFSISNLTGKMAIVGDGTEREKLETLTKELNISDRIDFLGWIDNPHQLMLQSKCLVMCSLYEGSPVTLAEAIALGVPIISYNSSAGIADLFTIDTAKFGLVPKQNIKALSSALEKCVQNPYKYNQECIDKVCMDNMQKRILQLCD
ncbi:MULTISPECIES: glycosyltransferase [unclassified Acinetobacter]|jgi:glycosyltransferase involved in cell wall biosynthesis|uniref:glycosyltransferase n=2 Tax=unclassified Acinetobacter TaxID=196816 RepID=UPI0015D1868A|nr:MULTISPECIES: glycosyltransferase [unclassified Acinetobacter]